MLYRRLSKLFFILIFIASNTFAGTDDYRDPALPNVIFIMLDDLDYYDLGVYGSPDILTDTIDNFATEGMRFSRYYASGPVCSPTRAAIVTGQYPAHYGVKRAITGNSFRGIPGSVTTIAEILKNADYRTAHIGKWHLGTNKSEFLPTKSGFDHSIRLDTSNGLSYLNFTINIDDQDTISYNDGSHLTTVLTNHAIGFIEDTLKTHPDQPFFLNLWYLAPHNPLNELPDNYDNSRTNYCLDIKTSEPECSSPRGNFSALVTHADRQIKRILELLDKNDNLRKNTLVVITSDNGGTRISHEKNILPVRKLRGFKGKVYEGAIRVPLIIRWPGVIPENVTNDSVVSSIDFFPTLLELTSSRDTETDIVGESFLKVLKGNPLKIRSGPLFWENKYTNKPFTNSSGTYNTYAVVDGDWKLIFIPATDRRNSDTVKLFNLRNDPSERNDLIDPDNTPLFETTLLEYRLAVSSAKVSDGDGRNAKYQELVNQLQNNYFQWRRKQGNIAYTPKLSRIGVKLRKNILEFSRGSATVSRDVRFDFHDGDFSFMTRLTPSRIDTRAVIAEKPGSWQLSIQDGMLKLHISGQEDSPKAKETSAVILQSTIEKNIEQHIAFTIFGWRDGPSTIRLYLNGNLVSESTAGNSVNAVRSSDLPDKDMIYIGNNVEGNAPFFGAMSLPSFSVLSLYPSEIFWNYAKLASY